MKGLFKIFTTLLVLIVLSSSCSKKLENSEAIDSYNGGNNAYSDDSFKASRDIQEDKKLKRRMKKDRKKAYKRAKKRAMRNRR
jgi:hypothetical protein